MKIRKKSVLSVSAVLI